LPAYGLMVAAGYLAALLYLNARAGTFSVNKEKLQDLVFWTIIYAMAGAKLFYAVTYWNSFGQNFLERTVYLFKTFQYGFVFYGGLIFGAAAFYIKSRKTGLDFLKMADLCAPALALGHAFGRLGCFFAGCCHGRPTASVFGVKFLDPRCEVSPTLLGVKVHPSQLYEAAGNLFIFFVLNSLLAKKSTAGGGRDGAVLAAYAALYALLRFLVEFLRGDDRGGFMLGLSPAQLISLFVLAAVVIYSLARPRLYGKNSL